MRLRDGKATTTDGPIADGVRNSTLARIAGAMRHAGMTPEEIGRHAADYRRVIEALRDVRIVPSQVGDLPRLNADLDALLGPSTSPSGET